jgi:hypothetical protein
MRLTRRTLPALLLAWPARAQAPLRPVTDSEPEGAALVARLRQGGMVLFFRHADTRGARLAELGIPVQRPVLAGPVYRARDTAEHAFGAADVRVTDSLIADDYAGSRLDWVLAEHRRLFSDSVPAGANRVLVGHRTPAIMVAGPSVGGRAFPEGAALVIEPLGSGFRLLGILMLAPIEGGGFHACG